VQRALKQMPIWTEFLDGVKGCGPALAGAILAEIDITKAQYVSSLWAYAGYDVAQDGRGRSKRKEHLIDVEYKDTNGKIASRVGITFNPNLRTKLFVLGTSFIKISDSPYRKIYDDYKNRLANHAIYGVQNDGKEIEGKGRVQPARRHMMSMRYMLKRFLVDLYVAWRTVEGLPVAPEYSVAKLGMVHGSAEKYRKAA
jgi:hypothetical protein